MMEAKDTVMGDKDFTQLAKDMPDIRGLHPVILAVINKQAKVTWDIAFKAGEEQGIQKGRKEVVESLRDLWTNGAITFLDSGAFKGKKLWAVPAPVGLSRFLSNAHHIWGIIILSL